MYVKRTKLQIRRQIQSVDNETKVKKDIKHIKH